MDVNEDETLSTNPPVMLHRLQQRLWERPGAMNTQQLHRHYSQQQSAVEQISRRLDWAENVQSRYLNAIERSPQFVPRFTGQRTPLTERTSFVYENTLYRYASDSPEPEPETPLQTFSAINPAPEAIRLAAPSEISAAPAEPIATSPVQALSDRVSRATPSEEPSETVGEAPAGLFRIRRSALSAASDQNIGSAAHSELSQPLVQLNTAGMSEGGLTQGSIAAASLPQGTSGSEVSAGEPLGQTRSAPSEIPTIKVSAVPSTRAIASPSLELQSQPSSPVVQRQPDPWAPGALPFTRNGVSNSNPIQTQEIESLPSIRLTSPAASPLPPPTLRLSLIQRQQNTATAAIADPLEQPLAQPIGLQRQAQAPPGNDNLSAEFTSVVSGTALPQSGVNFPAVTAQSPNIDVAKIAEQVSRILGRRLTVERERRGL
jgi:hypothetical protein